MDDAYSTSMSAAGESADVAGLSQLLALKSGDTFLVADSWGDLRGAADGLFVADTRILSRFVLTLGRSKPSRLTSGVSADNVFFSCHTTNRPLPPMGGRSAPAGVVHVERRRFLWEGRMYERLRMVNHGVDDILLPIAYDYAADFADIFEVRGTRRAQTGRCAEPELDGRRVALAYEGLDGRTRRSCLAFSEPPHKLTHLRADFMFSLPRGRRQDLYVECGAEQCDTPHETRFRQASVAARLHMRRKRRRGASLRGPRSPRFNDWLDQSRADMALLTTELETGPYPYAGVPWFSTPFGRDGIIAAWQMLWLDPALARGVLTYLARRQATEVSAFQDAQPGKIMHETRQGEMSALGEVPFALYYGGVDTTCLFVALAGAYARRTADLETLRGIWPNLLAATEWMATCGDSNGDGLIDYARAEQTGLSNQGWKDSEDSIFDRTGRFPKGPIALVEVQGYAFMAWRAMADLERWLGIGDGEAYAARAEAVRSLVEDRFWMADAGFYAVALDGDGRRCEALTSNAGHLLFSGLPAPARARQVSRRLMSGAFRSGWGIRTLAEGQPRYNPMSYHNGSVWPHDVAFAAAGMARYGDKDAARLLLEELHEAATHFHNRLPELFCGFPKGVGEPPIAYPVACLPQAWAAGSVFLMLQAALGVEIDAIAGEVRLQDPVLPNGLDRLTATGLQVGPASLDLQFTRIDGHVVVSPRNRTGPLKVTTVR